MNENNTQYNDRSDLRILKFDLDLIKLSRDYSKKSGDLGNSFVQKSFNTLFYSWNSILMWGEKCFF